MNSIAVRKSTNGRVNAYVRAVLKKRKLQAALEAAQVDMLRREGRLKGRQIAEAMNILREIPA